MKKLIVILILLLMVSAVSAVPTGYADVSVRCMHNLFSNEMTLTSFTNNAAVLAYVSPDGKWGEELLVGDYALILLDGQGGQREYRYFTVRPEAITHIDPFIGHAISEGGDRECDKVWVCGDWDTFCWGDVCIPNPGYCVWMEMCK